MAPPRESEPVPGTVVPEPSMPVDGTPARRTEYGLTVGTPAGFNIAYGYWRSRFGIRFSGLYHGLDQSGLQGGISYTLSRHGRTRHAIAAVRGRSRSGDGSWSYGGLVYQLNWRALFLETGLSAGSGDYSSPRPLLQIGLMEGSRRGL